VDIGSELFVLATTISYAQSKIVQADLNATQVGHTLALVHYLGQVTRQKVNELFRSIASNADSEGVALARELIA